MSRSREIKDLVSRYGPSDPLENGLENALPLAVPSFGPEEVAEAIDSLLSGWLTMGKKVQKFEKMWAEEVGVRHAIAVNSGSSALLVMLTAMVESGRLFREQEVVLPAVGWSTSLFSVAQAGLSPVLVDVDPDSLCIEGEFKRPALALHLLGCPSRARSPVLMEDACAAHGASVNGKKVGSVGDCGAFSFFFSHHITTIEGGMITTDHDDLAEACRSVRAHGWIRERSDRQQWIADHPDIDHRFLFATPGYNLRMTEVGGAFGIHQTPRLQNYCRIRRENHINWCQKIEDLSLPLRIFPELPGTSHAGFAFPLLLSDDSPLSRRELCEKLEEKGIQTRPISGSNLARQPAFSRLKNARVEGETPVADAVHERGFFVGQSHAFGEKEGDLLAAALKSAF